MSSVERKPMIAAWVPNRFHIHGCKYQQDKPNDKIEGDRAPTISSNSKTIPLAQYQVTIQSSPQRVASRLQKRNLQDTVGCFSAIAFQCMCIARSAQYGLKMPFIEDFLYVSIQFSLLASTLFICSRSEMLVLVQS